MIGVGVGVGGVTGLSDVECDYILGSVALSVGVSICVVIDIFDDVSTLGDGVGGFGFFSVLLSVSAIFCRSLCVGSPASKLGVVVEGVAVRIVIMSVAIYLKKLFKPIFGIGISLGKKLLCPHPLPTLSAKKIFNATVVLQ